MNEKSREAILAERKLRKAEKQSKKKQTPKNQKEGLPVHHSDVDGSLACVKNSQILPHSRKEENSNILPANPSNPTNIDTSEVASLLKKNVDEPSNDSMRTKETVNTKHDEIDSVPIKSKSQLKAERRAKQEAQRALKAQKKTEENVTEIKKPNPVSIKPKTKSSDKFSKPVGIHKIKLFSHLYRNTSLEEQKILANTPSDIHKAIVKLGVLYKNKVIIGSNSRVIALLNALKQVISDHQTPAEKDFSRGFEVVLVEIVQYLNNCRPSSVSMTNAVKYLKSHLSQLPNNITDQEAQIKLREAIDDYIKEQIDMAGKAICIMVQKKISQNDTILTFGYSSLIERILVESHQAGLKFRVIIVDAGPLFEGKELLRRLAKNNLNCIYVLLSAASYIIKEASKVLLGAHALLTNGYVMSRAGSSQVALIAKSYNVPVLVCCETHKFSERVQTDAFVHNELGDSDKLMDADKWKNNTFLTPLTLMYEVTPSDLVTAVVTELAILPCTSVPVVLRVKPTSSTT